MWISLKVRELAGLALLLCTLKRNYSIAVGFSLPPGRANHSQGLLGASAGHSGAVCTLTVVRRCIWTRPGAPWPPPEHCRLLHEEILLSSLWWVVWRICRRGEGAARGKRLGLGRSTRLQRSGLCSHLLYLNSKQDDPRKQVQVGDKHGQAELGGGGERNWKGKLWWKYRDYNSKKWRMANCTSEMRRGEMISLTLGLGWLCGWKRVNAGLVSLFWDLIDIRLCKF